MQNNDAEEEQKNKRVYDQTVCCQLDFNCMAVYGFIDNDDDLPSYLSVSFVPASLERLNKARKFVDEGAGLVGMNIRSVDIKSDVGSFSPNNCMILISSAGENSYSVEVQLTCSKTGCYFTADRQVESSWFEF
ncbi:hypothetical protein [Sansalvadorimonas verongulae]|uniref:hypothetical protein n=1 Tax=Sansalvadorimonas verongulae TaxID=2172824 RepID=UPI0012BCC6B1|nr:hypothetical protein [Sansalvadorimonas verongulae]MTI11685.1 hypothetical protein [Sansalvadorimonas verongulae]